MEYQYKRAEISVQAKVQKTAVLSHFLDFSRKNALFYISKAQPLKYLRAFPPQTSPAGELPGTPLARHRAEYFRSGSAQPAAASRKPGAELDAWQLALPLTWGRCPQPPVYRLGSRAEKGSRGEAPASYPFFGA